MCGRIDLNWRAEDLHDISTRGILIWTDLDEHLAQTLKSESTRTLPARIANCHTNIVIFVLSGLCFPVIACQIEYINPLAGGTLQRLCYTSTNKPDTHRKAYTQETESIDTMIPLPKTTTQPTTDSEVTIPLLYYVQRIQRLIYEMPSDEEAIQMVTDTFSPDATFEWNYEQLDLDGFKNFVNNWRTRYTFLDFQFHEAVASPNPDDEQGRGGTIGFAMRGRVLGKEDSKMYEGKVHAIYKVVWVPGADGSPDRRLITNSNQVLQGPYVIEEER
ncbi:uncharacterized protein BP01DRAFT_390247 [Aspergillus saccharolyticus JOP 1030-1]|uniref:SnoaL-like domain-containing protein n=1 Tax=Aspergillus saccharolyticus JOP 1030-1 TaxID=1450539 RepID=A0A319AKI9_9EURO|nr:hypothetical protein BP01DRAFT_390247 [Aspergillus saccharolyticus JOP 1030-1]PYH47132.1 hypothetical protein BP01DRAFT_390247 [Aspergillus saccharolyticus JOP 1030-1]